MKKVAIFFLLNTPFFMLQAQSKFEIQGHRGSRGLMPENTIPAFIKALDLGVDVLELDVVISKDKQVVVSHDPFFNPDITTDKNGIFVDKTDTRNLYTLDYKDIAGFDVGQRGNPRFPEQQKMAVVKPLLTDMLKAVEVYRIEKKLPEFHYNIELKSLPKEYNISQPEVAEFSALVYAEIIKQIAPERVVIQSFDFNVLKHWHEMTANGTFKKMRLSALIEPAASNVVQKNLDILGFTPEIWSPYYLRLGKRKVKQLHQLGIKVIPWTVNDLPAMQKMKAIGCDGLITDYPDKAKNL
jgi:glycerophosphoryl diester phosphodiesterase